MKMHKLLSSILILALALSMASCKNKNSSNASDDDNDYLEGGSNPYDDTSDGGITYVYSISSRTLHRETCYHSYAIDELYKKSYSGDITPLIERGFSFCALCCPEESELYNKKDESGPIDNGITRDEASYVLNVNSKKIHELDCKYATSMNPQNMQYTTLSVDELRQEGYLPCGTCEP